MTITIEMQMPPIQMDADNVLRVGGTRVPLDTVIEAFKEGATAEEIVQQYPTVQLADVYATFSYYLREREQIEQYLAERKRQAEEVHRCNEAKFNTQGLRERLLPVKRNCAITPNLHTNLLKRELNLIRDQAQIWDRRRRVPHTFRESASNQYTA